MFYKSQTEICKTRTQNTVACNSKDERSQIKRCLFSSGTPRGGVQMGQFALGPHESKGTLKFAKGGPQKVSLKKNYSQRFLYN